MRYAFIFLMLIAALAASPLHALEDEYGRLLPLHNEFAENVVIQSKANIAQDDPQDKLLWRAAGGLGVLVLLGGLTAWWRSSNPKVRLAVVARAPAAARLAASRTLRFTKKIARKLTSTPEEVAGRISSIQAQLARLASE